MDDARKGDVALGAAKYEEAVQHYDKAITASPTAVKYYIGRSTAYQRCAKYADALADAELAVALAHKRAVRELIKDAQFRRAIALYFLERYADAEYLLHVVGKLDAKEKSLPIWTMKVAAKLKDVPAGDERRTLTIKELPDVEVPTAPTAPKLDSIHASDSERPEKDPFVPPKAAAVAPTPANKIKHDWYQNNNNIVFSILAKGPKDDATVEIKMDSLSVSLPIEGSTSGWSFTADPLFAPIDPAQSTYRVTLNKVEVTLRKAKPGLKWHRLEGGAKAETADENKSGMPSHVADKGKSMETPPVYPTSSKSGAKNWDKVVEEDLEDKDLVEGDETSHFFKKLYADAAPEQQRAMMKSYQESGGTVLSTDWSNVGSGKVAPQPPEGCDAKEF